MQPLHTQVRPQLPLVCIPIPPSPLPLIRNRHKPLRRHPHRACLAYCFAGWETAVRILRFGPQAIGMTDPHTVRPLAAHLHPCRRHALPRFPPTTHRSQDKRTPRFPPSHLPRTHFPLLPSETRTPTTPSLPPRAFPQPGDGDHGGTGDNDNRLSDPEDDSDVESELGEDEERVTVLDWVRMHAPRGEVESTCYDDETRKIALAEWPWATGVEMDWNDDIRKAEMRNQDLAFALAEAWGDDDFEEDDSEGYECRAGAPQSDDDGDSRRRMNCSFFVFRLLCTVA
ncbi:hypothetical protein C8F01DRAFT_1264447 [Mycena amicta]|nr:hypothetical protein C8F01DRAFT_1264447 [Mycena amicta]